MRPFARESSRSGLFWHSSKISTLRILEIWVNLTILPLVYSLPLIDRSLPSEGGERAGGIERAQTVGRGQGGETQVDQEIGIVISVQFYPESQTFKKLSLSGAEKSKKISFRRDVVWSQRIICEQNEGAYKHL
ncbi:hypothetical protein PRIPAC_91761 [Pristionchus pacificus]|uniref:Uncharacterized protein n=1 Tax=Pristionchus pacificus TaxID=54126 RepID=A0A2A6BA74_PRIPA|nr:hypothetical protein PRIPAC_91761 [Pristionchus pacificus]|eukprot:PDM62767.1 hypothetical protein PRIPAC_49982 [Pristionchus pacificus]